jgi:hypothetical protein
VGHAQPGQGLWHQARAAARERRQAHPAGAQPGDRRDVLLGGGHPGQDRVGVGGQHLAGLGQAGPAAAAADQRGAGLPLQLPDLVGDGRLGVAERAGGPGERAAAGHLPQRHQPSHVQHGPIL